MIVARDPWMDTSSINMAGDIRPRTFLSADFSGAPANRYCQQGQSSTEGKGEEKDKVKTIP